MLGLDAILSPNDLPAPASGPCERAYELFGRRVGLAPVTEASEGQRADVDVAMGQYAEGDDASFAGVYAGLAPRLRLFLLRLSKSRPTADDLLQETFLRIHRARASFAVGARALPWSYAIARSVYIDHVRARAVRKETLADQGDAMPGTDVADAAEPDGEALAIARQTADVVSAILDKLPVNQREAFILLRYEGMSVADASRILGATEGAVKLRAFHAYEALRKALDMEHRKRGAQDASRKEGAK
jgi:RNA polymerase sigma-70 factor (ECF subfamily)